MTDEHFVYHVRQRLNGGLDCVSPGIACRLEAARHHALAHQKRHVRQAALVVTGGISSVCQMWPDDLRLRQALAILLLLLGIFLAVYWQGQQYVHDLEDIDSALLADSIPPHAFLDKDFAAWLQNSSGD